MAQTLSKNSKVVVFDPDVNLDNANTNNVKQGTTVDALGLTFTEGLPIRSADGNNIAIGIDALASYTGEGSNIAIGEEALETVTNTENTGIGIEALKLSGSADYATALGNAAGYNSSGTQNCWIGGYAGPYYSAHTGGFNTMVGVQAGIQMSGASEKNTGVGTGSFFNLSTGSFNVAIGLSAGSGITTGDNNIMIGYGNNGVSTGSNNVVIGHKTGLAPGLSDTIILAANDVTRLHIDSSGNAGFGTEVPTSKLTTEGTAMQQLRMVTAGGPASSADATGNIGDLAYDADYLYIKTSNGWGRLALDFAF